MDEMELPGAARGCGLIEHAYLAGSANATRAERRDVRASRCRVREALGELAGAAKEGLLALSVGVGFGVLSELMAEEVDERSRVNGRSCSAVWTGGSGNGPSGGCVR
jgi:hypothetical protein